MLIKQVTAMPLILRNLEERMPRAGRAPTIVGSAAAAAGVNRVNKVAVVITVANKAVR